MGSKAEYIKYIVTRPHHLIWHPSQGFWNIYTEWITGNTSVRSVVILVDTIFRMIQAFIRRAKKCGYKDILKGVVIPSNIGTILFLDIGVHKKPNESIKMIEWFGDSTSLSIACIEAHPKFCASAEKYWESEVPSQIKNKHDMKFINAALVGPGHNEEYVEINFEESSSGVEASIYRQEKDRSVKVDAKRISSLINNMGISIEDRFVLLRANIEGAEYDLIRDLLESDTIEYINGFFGTWDDVFKTDQNKYAEFVNTIRANNINTFPFNDRDLLLSHRSPRVLYKFREWCIKYEISTRALVYDN
jgi:FkbM family methyltransferase